MKCGSCGNELTTADDGFICSGCKLKQYNQQPVLQGWICPRCGVVHSPFVTECTCPPPIRTWFGTTTDDNNILTPNNK